MNVLGKLLVRFRRAFLVAALAVLATPVAAVPVTWQNAFTFSAPGVQNPLLQVGFNPQPEPPAGGLLSFAAPPNPAYPPDPIITHMGASNGTPFRLLFGMSAATPLSLDAIEFHGAGLVVLTIGAPSGIAGVPLFEVLFELGTTGGGVPIDWVAFNPQPEPPALGPGAISFGADFTFDTFSDATLRIRLHDATGMPLALTPIPEPGTLALLIVGLTMATGRRHGRRRAAKRDGGPRLDRSDLPQIRVFHPIRT